MWLLLLPSTLPGLLPAIKMVKLRDVLVFWKPVLVLLSFLSVVILQIVYTSTDNDSKVAFFFYQLILTPRYL